VSQHLVRVPADTNAVCMVCGAVVGWQLSGVAAVSIVRAEVWVAWEKTRWIDVHGIAPEDTPATADTYALNKKRRCRVSAHNPVYR
jgi:hypothetical protein